MRRLCRPNQHKELLAEVIRPARRCHAVNHLGQGIAVDALVDSWKPKEKDWTAMHPDPRRRRAEYLEEEYDYDNETSDSDASTSSASSADSLDEAPLMTAAAETLRQQHNRSMQVVKADEAGS